MPSCRALEPREAMSALLGALTQANPQVLAISAPSPFLGTGGPLLSWWLEAAEAQLWQLSEVQRPCSCLPFCL